MKRKHGSMCAGVALQGVRTFHITSKNNFLLKPLHKVETVAQRTYADACATVSNPSSARTCAACKAK
jgi:hypothetical protein